MFTKSEIKKFKSKLKGERVVLIGGAGFIGHNLALELKELVEDVFVVDNLMINNLITNIYDENIDKFKSNLYRSFLMERFEKIKKKKIKLINADSRNFHEISLIFEEIKPTKVVHLSAIASAVKARENPNLCFDVTLVSLKNLLELSRLKHNNINQFVFLSSSTVYGDFESNEVDENTRPRPRGIYANTKYMGERLVRTYCHQYNIGTTIIRPSALYGERCISKRVSQLFVENALQGKVSRLEGGGDGMLDFTYIKDLVNGMIRSLIFHGGPGFSQTFNITYGNARTISDLFDIVKKQIPLAKAKITKRSVDKPVRGTLSINRAREVLDYTPSWSLEEGYSEYIKWCVKKWKDIENSIGVNNV